MIMFGMRALSHPSDKRLVPRLAPTKGERSWSGIRARCDCSGDTPGIPLPLPDGSPEKTNFLNVLCEDGPFYEVIFLPLRSC
jgi:hypothetical protein